MAQCPWPGQRWPRFGRQSADKALARTFGINRYHRKGSRAGITVGFANPVRTLGKRSRWSGMSLAQGSRVRAQWMACNRETAGLADPHQRPRARLDRGYCANQPARQHGHHNRNLPRHIGRNDHRRQAGNQHRAFKCDVQRPRKIGDQPAQSGQKQWR